MNINEYITQKKKIIDKALNRYLPSSAAKPQIIHKAMRYSVFPGGKRIRPIFTIAGFEACGGKGSSIIPVACGIELVHSYTLVHDDMPCMDNDDLRRGKKTCHKKFGEGIALLTGDGLLTLAFQMIAESGNIDVMKEITEAIGTRGTIGGQVADMLNKKPSLAVARDRETRPILRMGTPQKPDIRYINEKKTAVLFEVAVKSGGIVKGASKLEINALGNFGRHIGLTFQLLDDIKDKDGYVKLYGEDLTKEKARVLTRKAKSCLKIFGKRADRLLKLTDLILNSAP